MHQNLGYLFAAFAVTWVGLSGYVFIVQRALAETNTRLRELEGDRAAPSGDVQAEQRGRV
jgi:CcmD family protein